MTAALDMDRLARIEAAGANQAETKPSTHDAKPTRVGRRRHQIVDEIMRLAKEPTLDLRIGGTTIARVRPGGIVTLVGGSGRGKTSLAGTIALEHAETRGPSIVYSLELPAYENGARDIGVKTGAAWMDVLEGAIPAARMLEAIPERLSIIDRSEATIEALEAEIEGMRTECPGQPILVVIDYVQLMEIAGAQLGQQRATVDQAMRIIDRVVRTRLVIGLVLSQGSRASAKALASGEIIGAQTTDAGAESAAIERWASCTLAIGEHGETGEDGSCPAPINIGKGRMLEGGGDAVIPARYHGRSGRWRTDGEPQRASEVRRARESERGLKKRETLKRAIVDLVSKSDMALSKAEITQRIEGSNTAIADSIKELVREGALAHHHAVARRGYAPVWTPDRIAATEAS